MREIVIKIDEGMYEDMLSDFDLARQIVRSFQATIADAIQKGVPLPEGHGDLIDRDNIEVLRLGNLTRQYDKGFDAGATCMVNRILDAPTILEADKEGDANEKG